MRINSLQAETVKKSSRKQNLVATSSTNAEYVALSEASGEALWIQKLLLDLNITGVRYHPAKMLCDNTGALALAYLPTHSKRSKHIDLRFHFVRDYVENGAVTLEHVISKNNLADGFTKSLNSNLFKEFASKCLEAAKLNTTLN